ncbi:hypothetical protein HJFPF1_00700 [Paramyrothecium foliicola]|nr:hypothetical protein HJFPF1_00700 [Paramyrothecium foliicola]
MPLVWGSISDDLSHTMMDGYLPATEQHAVSKFTVARLLARTNPSTKSFILPQNPTNIYTSTTSPIPTMSANINNLSAVSFLPVADRKHAQSLISAASGNSKQSKQQQDRAETASIASYSSSSALLKGSAKPSVSSSSQNLDPKKLQAQGFMSQIRFPH